MSSAVMRPSLAWPEHLRLWTRGFAGQWLAELKANCHRLQGVSPDQRTLANRKSGLPMENPEMVWILL